MKAKPKPKKPLRDSRTLGALVAMLIIAVASFFYIIPAVGRLSSGGSDDAASIKTELDRANAVLAARENERSALTEVAGSSIPDKLNIALPDSADIPGLIKFLSGAARGANVELTTLNVALRPGDTAAVDISLALSNVSYDRLKSFLNAIEKNLRLIDVGQLAYNPDARTVSIRAAAYAFDSSAAIAGARFDASIFSSDSFRELSAPPIFPAPSAPSLRVNPFVTSTFP